MNRQERRKQQRIDAKDKRRIWPSGTVEIPLDECLMRSGIKDGDMFTIAGVKRHKNGVIVRDCKPGTETTWVAKMVSPNDLGNRRGFIASGLSDVLCVFDERIRDV